MHNIRKIDKWLCTFVLIVFVMPFPVFADDNAFVFAGTEAVRNSLYGEWLTMIFTEVFRRLGYGFRCDGYPAARAAFLSDAGLVDGEISRVHEYQDTNPNLIRVEEVLYSTRFVAFAVKPGIMLNGWDSLKDMAYLVEYRQGVNLCERELNRVVAPENLSYVSDADLGVKKLILGRTDLFIDVEFTTIDVLNALDTRQYDPSVVYQAGIMQEIDAYSYLHRKHAGLLPEVEQILRDMKNEGLFDYYHSIVWGTR